jgi:hypothetical protein
MNISATLNKEVTGLNSGIHPVTIFLILNILDTLTTAYIVTHGGVELNLIYQWSHNMKVVFLTKWIVVSAITYYFYRKQSTKILWMFIAPMILVVMWNTWVIIRSLI